MKNENKDLGAAATASEAEDVEAGAATLPHIDDPADEQMPLPLDAALSPPPVEAIEHVTPKPISTTLEADQGVRSFTLEELLATDFPPRATLLNPWLPERGIVMVYAPRGVGKTHLALGCAYAVASGGTFLRWAAQVPRRVLLLDGEMPVTSLQERLAALHSKAGDLAPPGYIRIMPYDHFRDGGPDLSTQEGQAALEPLIDDANLIVVDSISTICRSGKENEAESWAAIQAWALGQRRRGRSILFVHHSGKSGDQRGTSKREDVMDTVIKLTRPRDYRAEDGARFIVEFTKNRGFFGPEAEAFEATLSDDGWQVGSMADARTSSIMELNEQGLSQREIASTMGISPATVNRTIKREMKQGSAPLSGCDKVCSA